MLALIFMNKIPWKLISAFYLPIHFAIGSFYMADYVLGGQSDCRNSCMWSPDCADADTLMKLDFFALSGVGLIILAFVLPSLIIYRNRKIIDTKIFR